MYAAIGGLKTHMTNLNVIGNNIANVNTPGYKAQRMIFQETIYTTSRAGSNGTEIRGGNTLPDRLRLPGGFHRPEHVPRYVQPHRRGDGLHD